MNDDTPNNEARRGRHGADAAGGDPDAALQKLESMGGRGSRSKAVPPAPVARETRPRQTAVGMAARPTRSRPRPAATTDGARVVVRIAAPVVFLIAVIALVSIAIQSGVIGGSTEPTPTPTPKTTETKARKTTSAGTKKYTVKSGDTLSGIAARFGTTVTELEELNPDLRSSTLRAGDKLLVPTS